MTWPKENEWFPCETNSFLRKYDNIPPHHWAAHVQRTTGYIKRLIICQEPAHKVRSTYQATQLLLYNVNSSFSILINNCRLINYSGLVYVSTVKILKLEWMGTGFKLRGTACPFFCTASNPTGLGRKQLHIFPGLTTNKTDDRRNPPYHISYIP